LIASSTIAIVMLGTVEDWFSRSVVAWTWASWGSEALVAAIGASERVAVEGWLSARVVDWRRDPERR
jgi:hypothetical protein